MCGRFVNHSSLSKIEETFNVDTVTCEVSANYNVAPTEEVLAVVRQADTRLGKLHWGLVPGWSKDISIGSRLINARSETISEKSSFRSAYSKRRCLVIADGFYEWKGKKGMKQPWYITLPSKEPFGFAGIWEIWRKGEVNEYKSCTIITTAASQSIKDIHHRMPVIIHPESYQQWLDPQQPEDKLNEILSDCIVNEFKAYPVSKRVNTVINNDPSCIEPIPSKK